ncbi:hypothetical protein P153DRAFT_368264 [Dothidotthia symphoricarpi CBS 119687]|uniref:Uncharacterized protein n=1 Tax=Dothidotthia symphoricarpi CBS 119687 TaxID=1392245 RepID=A0A6A6A9B2_9PLEO|nr:uncharacterized protein P153DRAFT_368264 [Dothidotthia symphoricarpi CBS 119687]KAF2127694.1 hypothetical protein P153DRAFT_368264 [Dothidotthia symphoricarpi CBS 119687]
MALENRTQCVSTEHNVFSHENRFPQLTNPAITHSTHASPSEQANKQQVPPHIPIPQIHRAEKSLRPYPKHLQTRHPPPSRDLPSAPIPSLTHPVPPSSM